MSTPKPAIKNDKLGSIVQVARLYYERDMSQQAIADKLGVSRSLIAKYLRESKELGIVRVQVVDPRQSSGDLSDKLRMRFGLRHVEVLPIAHASETLTLQGAANAAANYFAEHVQDGQQVGLAWGRSIKGVVDQLPAQKVAAKDVGVTPLMGESSNPRLYARMNELVEQMASSISGDPRFLFYPVTVDSKSLYLRIIQEPALVEVDRAWDALDWAFVGIGATPLTEGMSEYVDEQHLEALRKTSAVGDICCRYFDEQGRYVKTPFGERVIGVNVEQLERAGQVVAVATGAEKARAVRGALNTGLIDALFIDQSLAEAVLDGLEDA
ncbi:MAG: sugar-binding transcriptional regulator [Planctomycetota bacterium]|jgi:DNA-binding transcriptional regulator LsrR (DeoR family)